MNYLVFYLVIAVLPADYPKKWDFGGLVQKLDLDTGRSDPRTHLKLDVG